MKKFLFTTLIALLSVYAFPQDTLKVKNVQAILFTGNTQKQPLVVGLGGSEGGNAWTSDYWKKTRDEFVSKGFAFLAVGYFGCKETPAILDKIALEDVHNAIVMATANTKVDSKRIAVVGGSRGADLALLLASYYKEISVVVGMSSSHVVFPGHTQEFNSSCWTFRGKELPYIPVNEAAVPFLIKRDLRGTFEAMLQDTAAEEKALIQVENINGAVLLLSANRDEIIPAVAMAEKMIARMKAKNFSYEYKHITYEGGHSEPMNHFDVIFDFLETHLKK